MVSVEAELTFASLNLYHSALSGATQSPPVCDPHIIARRGGGTQAGGQGIANGQRVW